MNFRPELADAVMTGRKTVTRRLASDNARSPWYWRQCALKVGTDVAVCPGRGRNAIGRARIVAVTRESLGRLTNAEARNEGFEHTLAFERTWIEINGAYDPDALVWRIELWPCDRVVL